jgi:hypothetical protein
MERDRASALNSHQDDAIRKASFITRFALILHLVSCIYLSPFSQTILALAACFQRCARARILTDLNTGFK